MVDIKKNLFKKKSVKCSIGKQLIDKASLFWSHHRVSTGDSVIPSSFEMKYESAFKPLQGNPAFF